MTGLRIYLLGAPRFEKNGKVISPGRRKVIGLLAYLAMTGRPHNRDALAALFWPDYDQSGARANLRRDISRTKKAVGDEALYVESEQVGLAADYPVWTDAREFERLLDIAHQHGHSLRAGSPPLCADCARALTEAVELYQDSFMAGFSLLDSAPYDDWQFFQSEGLQQKLAEALQHLVHWHTQAGELEQSIAYARRWLNLDPLHELAHRQLMKLYAWAGQRSAALRQYEELTSILKRELRVEPEEASQALYQAIHSREFEEASRVDRQTLAPPDTPVQAKPYQPVSSGDALLPNNLPAQNTRFVGRQQEIEQLKELLIETPELRVVTLLGPGGSGKTRLAIQIASELTSSAGEHFPNGIWFAALAPLSDPEQIPSAIAQAVNFSLQSEPGQPEQLLIDYLRNLRLLLVLDNCEHLLNDASRQLLSKLVSQAPGIKLLATSRVRLNIHDERLHPVEGLSLPPRNQSGAWILENRALQGSSALALFEQNAARIQPGFKLTPENVLDALEICMLVEGMPLGIELAASWIEMLSPREIAVEIERSLDFLESNWRDMPERQRSLRAVFNSSWGLLEEQEQKAIASLSVFSGSFTREAAQAVSGASLKTLLSLVHNSWLQRLTDGRFAVHEMLRQYANEKLQAEPSAYEQARRRHAAHYADTLLALNLEMQGSRQKEAFEAVRDEFDNIRAAWNWLGRAGQFELLVYWMLPAVFRYCEARARSADLLSMVRRARQELEKHQDEYQDEYLLPILLTAQGAFYPDGTPVRYEAFGIAYYADVDAIRRAWELAQPTSRTSSSSYLDYWAVMLIYLYGREIDREAGLQTMELLLQDLRSRNEKWMTAFALLMLSQLHELHLSGAEEMEQTDRYLIEALELFVSLGDEREAGHTLRSLGNLRRFQERYEQAIDCWESAQGKLEAAGEWNLANDIHWQIGDLYLDLGQPEEAFPHYRAMGITYAERGYKWLAARTYSKESYEALRYGEVARAWETRQISLQYARESGDTFGEGWSTWELGEYYRLTGDVHKARHNFDRALHFFEQHNDDTGRTFFHRGLGDVNLQMEKFEEAHRQFELSRQIAENAGNEWGLSYALTGLSLSQIGLGDLEGLADRLQQALQLAYRWEHRGLIMHVLAAVASLYAARQDDSLAAETATYVQQHPTTWVEDKQHMQALLARLEQNMPDAEFEAARQRAGRRELKSFTVQEKTQ